MFEYAEEQILKKIQELDEKIILYEKEENICSRDKEYILSYININSGVNGLKKSVVFSNLLVMFLLVIGVMSGSGYAFLGSLACLSIAGIETFKIIKNNKILKDNYGDILGKTISELSSQLDEITKRQIYLSLQCKNLERNKNYYKIKLDKVDRYKNIFEDVVVNISKDPYYVADTEEEYKNLVSLKEKYSVMLDNYLDRKVDYSDIHFNYDMNKDFQYLDGNKKILKKM